MPSSLSRVGVSIRQNPIWRTVDHTAGRNGAGHEMIVTYELSGD